MRSFALAGVLALATLTGGCSFFDDLKFGSPNAPKRQTAQQANYQGPKSPAMRGPASTQTPGYVSPLVPTPPSAGPPSLHVDAPKGVTPVVILDPKLARAACEKRAKAMKFGIHWIKRNRFVRACIAGKV